MRKILPLRAWLAAGLILGSPFSHAASNLVFCSEGSPAGFDPAQYTTGTDYDATSVTLFNRLVQFERGGTGDPGPGGKLGHWRRRQDLHLPPAQGCEVPQHRLLQADPRIQCRRRAVHLRTHARQESSVPQGLPHRVSLLHRHGPGQEHRQGREARRAQGEVHPQRGRRGLHPEPGDGRRLDPVRRVRRAVARGRQATADQPEADRHRAFHPEPLPEGCADPLQGQQGLLETRRREDRQPDLLDQHRRRGARASSRPASARSPSTHAPPISRPCRKRRT